MSSPKQKDGGGEEKIRSSRKKKTVPEFQEDGLLDIHRAVISKDIEKVKERISLGDDPNAPAADGVTPLWLALAVDAEDIAQYLLGENADPTATMNGKNMLHTCAEHNSDQMFRTILDAMGKASSEGKDFRIQSVAMRRESDGKTPLQIAAEQRNRDIAMMIYSTGYRVPEDIAASDPYIGITMETWNRYLEKKMPVDFSSDDDEDGFDVLS